MGVTIFCIVTAFLFVLVKLILEVWEEKDREKGLAVDHETYTVQGICRLLWKDFLNSLKRDKKRKEGRDPDARKKE